ncbi:MAG: hypothetical protein ACRDT2_13970 [Natronosporangium sp.]
MQSTEQLTRSELTSDYEYPERGMEEHGAGRLMVLARDGVTEPSLVWKDTVLVRTGLVIDIVRDITNPTMTRNAAR